MTSTRASSNLFSTSESVPQTQIWLGYHLPQSGPLTSSPGSQGGVLWGLQWILTLLGTLTTLGLFLSPPTVPDLLFPRQCCRVARSALNQQGWRINSAAPLFSPAVGQIWSMLFVVSWRSWLNWAHVIAFLPSLSLSSSFTECSGIIN